MDIQRNLQQPSANIAAIAARIQDRAVHLLEEEQLLEEAEQQLKQVQSQKLHEDENYRSHRCEFLNSQIQLNSVELEYHKIQDDICKQKNKIMKLQQENNLNNELNNLHLKKWESLLCDHLNNDHTTSVSDDFLGIVSRHKTALVAYETYLQDSIDSFETSKSRREYIIKTTKDLTEHYIIQAQMTVQHQRETQKEIEWLVDQEIKENTKVEEVATRVRSLLTEVS